MIDSRFGCAALLALWLAMPATALAQEEAAVVRRATELREQPADAARSLAPLPQDAAITRLAERQGPWLRVRTASGATGWVHMFDIGAPGTTAPVSATSVTAAGSGLLRGVTGFFSKPAQPTTVSTSTIGIRGLGAEDLARAQPDTAAVGRMESLRATEQQARQFARDAKLAASPVEPLPAPPRSAGNPSSGGQP